MSQLIVITHQKPTMEIADALYGVTMRDDGITAVISQRMRGQDGSGGWGYAHSRGRAQRPGGIDGLHHHLTSPKPSSTQALNDRECDSAKDRAGREKRLGVF